MAYTIDFVPFATAGGANVTAQATYITESTTGSGFMSGVASSADCNKAWRQATFQGSVLANFVSNALNINVLDDGNLSSAITNLTNAVKSFSTNASNLTSGTLASARLPGTIAANTTGNAATATYATNAGTAANTPYSGLTGSVPTWNQNTTGNAATATNASTVTTSSLSVNGDVNVALVSGGYVYYCSGLTYNPAVNVLNTRGLIIGTTGQFTSSDERLKENFRPIASPLDILDAVDGVIFDWRERKDGDPMRTSVGFIAQQFRKAASELVYESPAGDGDESGTLHLNYDGATAVLWEAVKALRTEVNALRAELASSRGEP